MKKISVFIIVTGLILGGCCNKDFIIPNGNYDFREGAIDVTALINFCSDDEAYSTEGATPDGEFSPCIDDDPESNVWFKFIASDTEEIWIYIYVGGTQGSQSETILTLWDTDGITDLDCASQYYADDYVYLSYYSLIPGEQYFFSVDVYTSDAAGTFSLCLYDTD
jgi:hypothetical protein